VYIFNKQKCKILYIMSIVNSTYKCYNIDTRLRYGGDKMKKKQLEKLVFATAILNLVNSIVDLLRKLIE